MSAAFTPGPRLTKAQSKMLHLLSDGSRWDRRETLTQAQWAVLGRLAERGLVSRTTFHARITDAGKAALDAELLRDGNGRYSSVQLEEIALAKARGEDRGKPVPDHASGPGGPRGVDVYPPAGETP